MVPRRPRRLTGFFERQPLCVVVVHAILSRKGSFCILEQRRQDEDSTQPSISLGCVWAMTPSSLVTTWFFARIAPLLLTAVRAVFSLSENI